LYFEALVDDIEEGVTVVVVVGVVIVVVSEEDKVEDEGEARCIVPLF